MVQPLGHHFPLAAPPTTAPEYRTVFNRHDERWQGADGGHPVPLPDGRVLWLFGDTLYGRVQPDGSLTTGWGMAHGSALIQDGPASTPSTAPAALPPPHWSRP